MTTIEVAGRPRTYTLVTPDGGDHDRLLLVFHGSKQDGATFRRFSGNAFDRLGSTAVAYLDGHRANWNDARRNAHFPARTDDVDDVAFAVAVAAREAEGRETFAAGYSNGGGMVIRLLHERPDVISGGAVIAAQQPTPENSLVEDLPAVPRPVLLFHGTRDRIVPYDGGTMAGWARWAFKVGGTMRSAPETAAYFAARNGISAPPVTTPVPARDALSARTSVSRTDHRQEGRAPVTLYTVHGGGHSVPGPKAAPRVLGRTATDVHAAPVIAEFFGLS
jgi:polyhydroxybutyrate depolymerase